MTRQSHRSRFVAVGILLAVLALTVSACAGDEGPAATRAPQAPAQPAAPAPASAGADPAAPQAPVVSGSTASTVRASSGAASPKPAVAPAGAGAKFGGIMIMANRDDGRRGWDPMRSGSISNMHVIASINNGGNIIRQCRDDVFQVCPNLAESWENKDNTEWTFTLRDNIFWHDGKPVTTEDVKFWLELWVNGYRYEAPDGTVKERRKGGGYTTLALKSVDVLDGKRVRITLSEPNPLYLTFLSQENKQIAHPRHLVLPELQKGNVHVAPVDTGMISVGPFKFKSHMKGSKVEVRRFDRYWEKDDQGRQLPYLDGIDYAVIGDPGAMDAAFRTNRLDGTARGGGFQLTPERKAGIDKTFGADEVWYARMPQGSSLNLSPNSISGGPWKDVRVRRALNLWMDRQDLVKTGFGGFADAVAMFNPTSPWGNAELMKTPGWNPDTKAADRVEAKRLLAEAGFPKGFKTEFMCRRLWVSNFCEPALTQLLEMGLDVTLKPEDDAAQSDRILRLDFDIKFDGPSNVYPEQYETSLQAHSDFEGSGNKHNDPLVKTFFERLRKARSIEERAPIARELEKYVTEEKVYGIYLYEEMAYVAYRNYVMGMPVPAVNYRILLDHATVWLNK